MSAIKGQESATTSYATALYNVAQRQGNVAALKGEAESLAQILATNPRSLRFLESPQIPSERKRSFIDAAFGGKVDALLVNLLRILAERERAILLPGILAEFHEIADRADGIYPASVTSAREMGDNEKENLQRALEKYTGCKLKITYRVRKEILGGIVFRFKDLLVDGSVRHGLTEIRRRFEAV